MFKVFVFSMINFKFMVVPFGTRNLKAPFGSDFIGYTDYLIFGIRVARIQKTQPW